MTITDQQRETAQATLAAYTPFDGDALSLSKVDRVRIAGDEQKARKAALLLGETVPATPVLDVMNSADYREKKEQQKVSNSTRTTGPKMQFYKGGRAMNPSNNVISSLAYQATRGIGGESVERIKTDALIEILRKGGITEPTSTEWDFTLPNGQTISARFVEGSKLPAPVKPERPAVARKAAAKKAPAKKAATSSKAAAKKSPAKKAAAAKKAPAAKKAGTLARDNVVPIPKASSRKRAAAK